MKPLQIIAILGLCTTAQGAAALSLPSWLQFSSKAQEGGPPHPVVSMILEDRGAEARWIPATIESRTQVDMAFQTLGRIVERRVDLGDRVRKGDLLAEMATEDLVANTRAARANLQSAQVQFDTARTTLTRTQALARRSVVSDAQLEQAQRAAIAASAAVEQARGELMQAEDAEGFARMVAPFDGVISAVYEAPGSVVGAGAAVLQLSADDEREAVIDLPEATLSSLPKDAIFSIWHRNAPEHQVPAVLDRIEPRADTATRTRRVHLRLQEDADFLLGSLVRAHLGTMNDPALVIPTAAIFQRDDQPHVWRVRRDGDSGHVDAVPIETTASLLDQVVVSAGLEEQDEIVIRGVNSLQDGQAVGRRVAP